MRRTGRLLLLVLRAVIEHDHDRALAMFGECPTCVLAATAALPDPLPEPDGGTYEPEHDRARLGAQARLVWDVMIDGTWRTLAELADRTGAPEASVSARLRDLRKPEWGGYEVERRRRVNAYEYRLVLPPAGG